MTGRFQHGLNGKTDGRWESKFGAGVCRNLPDPSGDNSADHCACDRDPGFVDFVVGGIHKTCRINCSFGYEVVECQDAMMSMSAFSGW